MTQKQAKDFWLWLLSLGATLGAVAWILRKWYIVNHDNNVSNDYTDPTRLILIICLLFVIALVINIINTFHIFSEFEQLKRSKGLFNEHIHNLKRAAYQNTSVDQEFSIDLIENRLLRRESWVQLLSNLMITLGMVGTVLGLTISMSGLQKAMDSITINSEPLVGEMNASGLSPSPISGLGEALAGMSGAFITTLAGAVLGGLFLKVLSHSTVNLIEDLLDNIRYKTELEHIPEIQQQIWKREIESISQASEKLRSFIKISDGVDQSLTTMIRGLNNATENMIDFTESWKQGVSETERKYLLDKLNRVIQLQNIFVMTLLGTLIVLTLILLYQIIF